ncbi:18909_t:CDS:2, partial [Racocetra persica]
ISLQDKDLSVLDELVAEICGEQKPESPEPDKKNDSPTNKNNQPNPPTQHDINKKYQNDAQKQEIKRKQSNFQIVTELLQLKKDYPNIYQLLNKEGRVDKVITKLQELEKGQKNNQQLRKKSQFQVEIFSTAQQALREVNKYDLTIIDGPARTSHATLEIAQKSDLVIQPAGPSLDDLVPAVKEFHALVQAGVKKKKLIFALNRIATPAEEAGARKYLSKADYSVLITPLLEKTSYRQAQNQGLAITEVIYMGLKDQAKKLIQEIIKKVNEQ